jgi:cyclase
MMQGDLFMNSRQFTLNPVGNLETIIQYLHFDSIDELVVLNVARDAKKVAGFAEQVRHLCRLCFVPVAAGGGVRTLADCQLLLDAGADKIVINTAFIDDPNFVREAAARYGNQCIVRSIDVKKSRKGVYEGWVENGTKNTDVDVVTLAQESVSLGAGEVFLTSIDHDGVCQGYDLGLVRSVVDNISIPVIASGGVGEFSHLVDGIKIGHANGVSAGNIFHFIGHGLQKAKQYVRENGLDFPDPLWNFQQQHKL